MKKLTKDNQKNYEKYLTYLNYMDKHYYSVCHTNEQKDKFIKSDLGLDAIKLCLSIKDIKSSASDIYNSSHALFYVTKITHNNIAKELFSNTLLKKVFPGFGYFKSSVMNKFLREHLRLLNMENDNIGK